MKTRHINHIQRGLGGHKGGMGIQSLILHGSSGSFAPLLIRILKMDVKMG